MEVNKRIFIMKVNKRIFILWENIYNKKIRISGASQKPKLAFVRQHSLNESAMGPTSFGSCEFLTGEHPLDIISEYSTMPQTNCSISQLPQPTREFQIPRTGVPQTIGEYQMSQADVPQQTREYQMPQAGVPQTTREYQMSQAGVPQQTRKYQMSQAGVPQTMAEFRTAVAQSNGFADMKMEKDAELLTELTAMELGRK